MAELESVMEQKLIDELTNGISQWKYRGDLKSEDALWANVRQKLNQNNQAVLNSVPITDAEFAQIRQYVLDQAVTPYRAALWLAGENGEAVIPLVREDVALGAVHLMAVSSREIAGGRSSYEIINQFVSSKSGESDRERRFDVTLLINGLPMIQIELKNQAHSYMDAFRQIKKYSVQGKFHGLFGLVQMFVVTNGEGTRYIAADTGDRLNEAFLSSWVNAKNEPIENYLEFAREVLKIPEAHQMVGHYSVLDTERRKLILLRPYQVHAIEAVKAASARQESGFVWHTTGSGKTLTSYMVTKNLLRLPGIDKAIFLIDRRDLDQQTSTSFKAYAENDAIDVDDTENTDALVKKLINSDRQAIITTIQKLSIIMKRYSREEKKDSPRTKKLRNLKIGFVVDECHRTVTPDTQRKLKAFFGNSLWYGFTGTPIFDENKRARKGDLPRTTEQLFGPCLHGYTIKEALHDKAVLGFQIEYMDSVSDETLMNIGEKLGIAREKAEAMERHEAETKILNAYYTNTGRDVYDSEDHRAAVVETIVNQSAGKFRLSAPMGEAYEAILTVGSIQEAQEYYRRIKEFVSSGKVKKSVREKLNDFPKVAVTYTVTENENASIENQAAMADSLKDYNEMFHTNFSIEDMRGYNTNLNDRLARKKGRYKRREEQLDLVIVVDRLLTGFDAPPCAILFIDRPPMSPQGILQAFSRTNRIFDKAKRYGMIVIFQRSATYRKAVDDALLLYSHGGTNDVSAPPFEEIEKQFREAIRAVRSLAKMPTDVDSLSALAEKKKFAKAFQKLDRLYGEIQVYQAWEEKDLARDYHIDLEEIQGYSGKYRNVLEEIRKAQEENGEPASLDVEYELETVRIETIDYRYLIALIQKHIPDEDEIIVEDIHDDAIDKHIRNLRETNPALANVVSETWEDIKREPERFRGQNALAIVEKRIDDTVRQKAEAFAKQWCVPTEQVMFMLDTFNHDTPVQLSGNFDKFRERYAINKLQYKKQMKMAAAELAEQLRPLRDK